MLRKLDVLYEEFMDIPEAVTQGSPMARSANGHVYYPYLVPEASNGMQGQATLSLTVADHSSSNE